MPDPILHHYASSPFSEKLRLMLGFKAIAWRSVKVPNMMPKPDVVALTGGYRKTPVLQIGSHVYCDTALIADVLEHLAPNPTLYPAGRKGLARTVAQWADERLFWAAMGYNFHPKGAAQLFGGAADAPPETWGPVAKVFADDRAKMRVSVPRLPWSDACAAYKSYLRRLSNMLDDGNAFLLGDAPSIADFSAYHSLWFTRTQVSSLSSILDATPRVLAWMDRVAAFAGPQGHPMASADAIEIARSSPAVGAVLSDEPFQAEHGLVKGTEVAITSDHFGPEPSVGELVASTRTHYTIRRSDERAGQVHVHFPRVGYVLRAVDAGAR